jgi:hypothetical protein
MRMDEHTHVLRRSSLVCEIGKNRPRAGKQKLRNISAGLHNLELGRFTDGGRTADIRNLRGQLLLSAPYVLRMPRLWL